MECPSRRTGILNVRICGQLTTVAFFEGICPDTIELLVGYNFFVFDRRQSWKEAFEFIEDEIRSRSDLSL